MDIVQAAASFLGSIWNFILGAFEFLGNSIVNIDKLFNYLASVVFGIPTILMKLFNNLPEFLRSGVLVVSVCIVFVLILKIIKTVRDATL